MNTVKDITALEALYGDVNRDSIAKVATYLTDEYAAWLKVAKFCVLTTVGPNGTDGSPRGDAGPVVTILDQSRVAMPDWRGNNRLDSLRNIVEDGRVSLMFMVPGNNTVIRLNGRAVLTTDPDLLGQFEQAGKHPTTVIVITLTEIYTQCARALLRAGLWAGEDSPKLPTPGEILEAQTKGRVDGPAYDSAWPERAAKTMW